MYLRILSIAFNWIEFQQFSAYCEPFHKPGMEQNAGAVQPDIMSEEEAFWFADYARLVKFCQIIQP